MNDLEKLLQNNNLKKSLKIVLESAIKEFEVNQCFWAVRNIEGDYKALSPESKKIFEAEFRPLFMKVKWLAVPRFRDGEILDLLEHQTLVIRGFDQDFFDLTETIKACLLNKIDYEERDQFKIKVRQSLLANSEVINQQAPVKTIGDWLRNIISKVGLQLIDRVKESEYYLKDENFTKLKKDEQEFLRKVISLYKYCLYSSQTPEGLDESFNVTHDGQLKTIERGQMVNLQSLDKKTDEVIKSFISETPAKKVSKKKTSDPAILKKMKNDYRKILSEFSKQAKGKDAPKASKLPEVILDSLNSNLALGDTPAVLVDFASLIKQKGLDKLIKSKNFSEEFSMYLEIYFGQPVQDLVKKASPEIISLFFQFIFISKLKLNLEKSAVLGLYLANILAKQGQKQFLPIVYADTGSGTFKWKKVKLEGKELVFE